MSQVIGKNKSTQMYYYVNIKKQRDMYCRLKSSDDVESGMCRSGAYIGSLEDKIVRALHGKWRRKINQWDNNLI